jgi:AcrR family transcriptional regulator
MARAKVDRDEKRKEIAYKAYAYIYEFGINEFSTNNFIKYLNIGKSSLYHYYKTKDEIIYEMMYVLTAEALVDYEKRIKKQNDFRKKLNIYFEFYLNDSDSNIEFRKLYKEFLFVDEDSKTEFMKDREQKLLGLYYDLLHSIIYEEVEKSNLSEEANTLINTLMTTADGMLIYSFTFKDFDLSNELSNYLDSFIKLLTKK